jgi:hemoglobin-like flavoprotein
MTSKQIELVQQSWSLVQPISKEAGLIFYRHLFETAPQIRHLFKEDITEQSAKLMRMLTYIVSRLTRLEDILPDIDHLAASHNRYGAQPEHYAVVGDCLIKTLRDGLGTAWNSELQEAWITVFTLLKDAMIQAQQKHRMSAPSEKSTDAIPM